MGKPDHNYDRLPKWAQDEIRVLRQNAEHWKGQALAAAAEDAAVAPITIGINPKDERGLPDECVFFYPDPTDRSLYIQVQLRGEGVDINATRPVSLRMRSSNAFQVDMVDF